MPIASSSLSRTPLDQLTLLIATGLGVGWLPVVPGTFGSLWGVLIAWGLSLTGWSIASQAVCLLVGCGLGVAICQRAARLLALKDPGPVVYDEFLSLPLAFLIIPFSWPTAAAVFLIFRILDMAKPWPICRLERLPGGWGIMADDMAASVVTGAILAAWQQLGGA
ncbi:MAG: phosphatidylglycerophosphatase A [Planctomycetaceae bacterium]